jgi:predicted secreted protein
MSRRTFTRLSAAAAAVVLASAAMVAAPAQAKPVDNTVTVTILPAQLRLVPGESATVRLQTNLTTGYSWSYRVVGDRNAVRVVQNSPAELPAGSLIGAPTTTDWVVTATSRGTAVVRFLTTPPGGGKASSVGSLTVIVRR